MAAAHDYSGHASRSARGRDDRLSGDALNNATLAFDRSDALILGGVICAWAN